MEIFNYPTSQPTTSQLSLWHIHTTNFYIPTTFDSYQLVKAEVFTQKTDHGIRLDPGMWLDDSSKRGFSLWLTADS